MKPRGCADALAGDERGRFTPAGIDGGEGFGKEIGGGVGGGHFGQNVQNGADGFELLPDARGLWGSATRAPLSIRMGAGFEIEIDSATVIVLQLRHKLPGMMTAPWPPSGYVPLTSGTIQALSFGRNRD
jgi:hypothetical protein